MRLRWEMPKMLGKFGCRGLSAIRVLASREPAVDATARMLKARAFTLGNDVGHNARRVTPRRSECRHCLS